MTRFTRSMFVLLALGAVASLLLAVVVPGFGVSCFALVFAVFVLVWQTYRADQERLRRRQELLALYPNLERHLPRK